MTACVRAPVIENDQKRSIRGTARAFQGALSIAKAVQVNAARHDVNRGRTPIGSAAAAGRLIEVEQLLDSGVNVNEQDAFGETALHLACMEGQYKVVRMLVVEQQARVDLQNWEGWVPMIWAIVRGHIQIVKFLSERGSSLQWKSYLGWTPLHFAAIQGDLELVDWLLEEGADALATGDDGCMPGDCASNAAVRKTLYKTVAHQKLSAGEDQRVVRAFLEGHRMSHILDHEDLHQTLAQLPEPHNAHRSSALAATHFMGRLSTTSRAGRVRSARRAGPLLPAGKGGARGSRRDRSPSLHRRAATTAAPETRLGVLPSAAAGTEEPAGGRLVALNSGVGRTGGQRATESAAAAADVQIAHALGPSMTVSGDLGVDGKALQGQADSSEALQEDVRGFAGCRRRSTVGQGVRFNEAHVRLTGGKASDGQQQADAIMGSWKQEWAFLESDDGEVSHTPLLLSGVPGTAQFSEITGGVATTQEDARTVTTHHAHGNAAQLGPCNAPGGIGSSHQAEETIINNFLGCMQTHAE